MRAVVVHIVQIASATQWGLTVVQSCTILIHLISRNSLKIFSRSKENLKCSKMFSNHSKTFIWIGASKKLIYTECFVNLRFVPLPKWCCLPTIPLDSSRYRWGIISTIVLKYSGHAMWFGPVLGQQLWQLSRLAWKRKNVNATYLLFILEEIKIA